MLKKKWLVMLGLAIALGAGFVAGQQVQAGTSEPGSSGDPLVAESYVKTKVDEQVNLLQNKIKELQAKADALQTRVNELEKQVK